MAGNHSRCLDCLARDSSLCASLRDDELAELSAIGRRKVYPAGQVVTWSGDDNTICANVVSGALKVTASTGDGREQIVGLLYQGDFVGQPFAGEASMTITAVADTDLCIFPRAGFERTLGERPQMERMLLERTMASLGEAQRRMLALGRQNAHERIAGFLLDVVKRTTAEDAPLPLKVEIPISRGEMADYLGLTIETVSRQLARLRSEKVIAFEKGDRSCTVLDRDVLDAIANPD